MQWIYEKFRGNMAIYAICPVCNYATDKSKFDQQTGHFTITNPFTFCPMCGEFLFSIDDDCDVIWNERNITEHFEDEIDAAYIQRIRKERLGETNDIKQSN